MTDCMNPDRLPILAAENGPDGMQGVVGHAVVELKWRHDERGLSLLETMRPREVEECQKRKML
jgi:hypothetical protein